MKILILIINLTYILLNIKDYLLFFIRIRSFKRVQKKILLKNIRQNKNSKFGTKHNFNKINSIKDFQKNVHIQNYDDLIEYISIIKNQANTNVLTKEAVTLLEPTSGSTNGTKFIPFTKTLNKEILNAVKVWIVDLYLNNPSLLVKKSYWSISPVVCGNSKTESGIPVGFEEDLEYLGYAGRMLGSTFPVPSFVRFFKEPDNFRYVTVLYLLNCEELGFISVWSPTFLIILTEYIDENINKICENIKINNFILPAANSQDQKLFDRNFKIQFSKKRSQIIQSAYMDKNFTKRYIIIWDKLELISTWCDSYSKNHIPKLKMIFPDMKIQPKGLIATEGIISFPLSKLNNRSIAAYNSHFLEFLPLDPDNNDTDKTKLLHQLVINKKYSVIITTGNGFYRYDLGDIIEVTGKYKSLPVIKFTGRNETFDFVGEKLEENFILTSIKNALGKHFDHLEFMLFAPEQEDKLNYALFLEFDETNKVELSSLNLKLDTELKKNYYYEYARGMGQLNSCKVYYVSNGTKKYTERLLDAGMKHGDIKPRYFDKRFDWKKFLLD